VTELVDVCKDCLSNPDLMNEVSEWR
jgi:hypothetical protein